jgi:hypothetical protein
LKSVDPTLADGASFNGGLPVLPDRALPDLSRPQAGDRTRTGERSSGPTGSPLVEEKPAAAGPARGRQSFADNSFQHRPGGPMRNTRNASKSGSVNTRISCVHTVD